MKRYIALPFITLVGVVIMLGISAGSASAQTRPLYDAYPSGYSSLTGNYTMGYRFTPNSNGQITHLWCYGSGTRTVYLFADNGTQLASTSVNCNGTWNSGAITPVNVTAGTYYKVAHYVPGTIWRYVDASSVPFSSGGITIDKGVYTSGNGNPTTTGDLSGRRISGLSDVTFVSSGGGGETPFQTGYSSGYSGPTGWNYTMGYRFSPEVNGQITHLWCYSNGTKTVKLYASNGSLLASTTANCNGTWGSGSITPVNVTAGSQYVVAQVVNGSGGYSRSGANGTIGNIDILYGTYSGGDAFPTTNAGSTVYGLADITFTTGGGGGSGGWTWLQNGNSSYNGTVSNSTIGTIPAGATHWAFGAWADESNYTNLSGDQGNYTMTFNGTSSCTNSNAPGSGSVETDCVVSSNTITNQSYSPSGITECDIFYNASTRVVTFTDNSVSESCHFAVFYYGSAPTSTPTPTPTRTPTPTPTRTPTPTPTRTPTPTITPTPTPTGPQVTTNAASSVTQTTATINATANPNGVASTGWFRYYTSNPGSCSDSGGTRVPSSSGTSLGSGSSGVAYNRPLTGLSAGTTYYVCAFATNSNGTGYGNVVSFTTNSGTPTSVTNSGESNLGSYYVTLNASANPNNFATTGFFRVYDSNPGSCIDSGGTRFPENPENDSNLGSGDSGQAYSYELVQEPIEGTNIVPETTYYYCAFAKNINGTVASSVDSFTTPAGPRSACDPPVSGNHTIISSCAYSGNVGGVDAGTGSRNTGIMTINSGKLLTTNPDQQVAWGGININGAINIAPGAALRATPVWVIDADGDGYISSSEQFIGTQPEGGTRRSALSENYAYYSQIANSTTFDCNDDNEYIYVNRDNMVIDTDNDGYKTSASASTQCTGDATTINGRTYYANGSGSIAPVTKGESSSNTMTNGTGFGWSHTVSGSNKLLVVSVSYRPETPTENAVTNVYYNNVPLTKYAQSQVSTGGTARKVEMWYMVNPPTGTYSVAVSFDNAADAVGGAVTYTGVDQEDPFGTPVTANGEGAGTASVVVASSVNDLVVDFLAKRDANSITAGAGQTVSYNTVEGNNTRGVSSYETGINGNVTMSWTVGNNWAQIGVNINANPGASPSYGFMNSASALSGGATDCDDTTGAPCPPTTPSVGSASQTSLSVSWSPTTGPAATSYTLRWCQGTSCTPETNISGISSGASSYNHNSSLSCGQTYRYRIVAINAEGQAGSGIGQGSTSACQSIPTVTSPTHSSVTGTTATLGANVTSDGGATITSRGTCWGTSNNPTTNCASTSGTTGSFTHGRTGLPSNTTIYYRGYATNSQGTGYSVSSSFTTPNLLSNGQNCTSDAQCSSGNCYVDSDNDRYAPSSGTKTCRANSQLSGTDCYDSNSNARPGQTSYFTTSRGDGSFDYNCVSGEEKNVNAPGLWSDYPGSITCKSGSDLGGWSGTLYGSSGPNSGSCNYGSTSYSGRVCSNVKGTNAACGEYYGSGTYGSGWWHPSSGCWGSSYKLVSGTVGCR